MNDLKQNTMRVIKFRAWDSISNKLHYWDIIKVTPLHRFQELEHYTLMQFTGLKDKNSKEIYEGDIIDILDPTTRPKPIRCTVKFNERIAAFEGFCDRPYSLFLHNNNAESHLKYDILKSGRTIEIIGNIHQNPEMI